MNPAGTMATTESRYGSLDALRAFCMFLGVLLHAAMAYMIFPYEKSIKDPLHQHIAYDVSFFLIHGFRMQLFYIIAGFFFRLLYLKIGEAAFIKHRIQRIFLPFLVGLFTILPITFLPGVVQDVTNGGAHLTMGDIQQIVRDIFVWRGPLHLWFLYYLLLFYAIGILLKKFVSPLLNRVPPMEKKVPLPVVIFFIICLSFLTLCLFDTPYVYYSPGLFPKPSFMLYYGFFFYLGWQLHIRRIAYFEGVKKVGVTCAVAGMALMVLCFYMSKNILVPEATGRGTLLLFKLIMSAATMLTSVGVLGIFMKWINAERPVIRYLSDSSYWVYLVHVAVVNAMQILLSGVTMWGPGKFLLTVLVSTVISLATYEWFVRYTVIGVYLHGKRKKPIRLPEAS